MNLRLCTIALTAAALAAAPSAPRAESADSNEAERIRQASEVLTEFGRIPETRIPDGLLSQAYGIAIVPNVIKVGFILGARRGRGVLMVRDDDGRWSNPAFITLTGGSFGWQIGGQSTDVILVFKSRRSIDGITGGKFTLGADASVAAGPVGRQTGAATDVSFGAEVYSYSRSRGLFVGVALEGASMQIDESANRAYYGSGTLTAADVLQDRSLRSPPDAEALIANVTATAPALVAPQPDTAAGSRTAPGERAPAAPTRERDDREEARIFVLED